MSMYAAKILADSITECGVRLTTMEVTFPRFILAEFNTHRMFSRNSASSRAIPVEKRIAQVRENPFVPEAFGVNKSGMQAVAVLDDRDGSKARDVWLRACAAAIEQADALVSLGVHKQHANRILEPYVWHTVVVSFTESENFFALRDHHAAQPEMQITAKLMREAFEASTPRLLKVGEWHLPYVNDGQGPDPDFDPETLDGQIALDEAIRASVVRCAAVSFERQNAHREQDAIKKRHDDMVRMAHWSPFEHQACVAGPTQVRKHALWRYTGEQDEDGRYAIVPVYIGNFRSPWLQYRKMFSGENVFHDKEQV